MLLGKTFAFPALGFGLFSRAFSVRLGEGKHQKFTQKKNHKMPLPQCGLPHHVLAVRNVKNSDKKTTLEKPWWFGTSPRYPIVVWGI